MKLSIFLTQTLIFKLTVFYYLTFFPLYEKRRKKQHTVVGLYGLALATDNITKGLIYGHNVAR